MKDAALPDSLKISAFRLDKPANNGRARLPPSRRPAFATFLVRRVR